MFRSAFVAFVLASAALASPMKRFGGIIVDVAGPTGSVSNVDDLKFTATVKNTGSEDVKILKYGTILDENLPTRSFTVTKDGEEVPFTGVKLQVSLQEADDSAYVFIPAGESVTVNHDVAALFDFASAGAGTIKFEPQIDVTSSAVEVNVTDKLEKRDLVHNKRATDIALTLRERASSMLRAYSEGKSMASAAASFISSNSGSTTYTAYFKTNSASTVRSKFSAVASENSSSRTSTSAPSSSTKSLRVRSALVRPLLRLETFRGATVLHELTHAVASTVDVTYGCSADQSLSASNQLRNADNYNCFGSQIELDPDIIDAYCGGALAKNAANSA
ncbi:hypothetical protein VNI00_000282 [Paramarasmius palmivorus]|uniref:deuterolysin n=1 Tax=Paramarasmius palmivorus TaxID=297713 RepID=A0AAW0EGL8_9AGAR